MSTITSVSSAEGHLLSEQQLRDSLAFVSKAKNPKSTGAITDLNRVNEQDMFAAVVHGQLVTKGRRISAEFESKFTTLVQDLFKKDPANGVFESARKALRGLRRAGAVTKDVAKSIRQDTLGRSQLDSKRDLLSTKNITGKAGDTALRAVKTAVSKFSKSTAATDEEFKSFKLNNAVRRAEARAAKATLHDKGIKKDE